MTAGLEMEIRVIPGVVGSGLFLGMADTVLVGDRKDFWIIEEKRRRDSQRRPAPVAPAMQACLRIC